VRIKVDENIGRSGVELLRQADHYVKTVREQDLAGAADELIFQTCIGEERTLITLDRDFGHIPRFPPKRSAGVVVLKLVGPASLRLIHDRLRDFLFVARNRSVSASLGS
jgi:predicted nuclease of predicted toxin-antitoxin system